MVKFYFLLFAIPGASAAAQRCKLFPFGGGILFVEVNSELVLYCPQEFQARKFFCQENGIFAPDLATLGCEQGLTSPAAGCQVETQPDNGRLIPGDGLVPNATELTLLCEAGYTAGDFANFTCRDGVFEPPLSQAVCELGK